MNSFFFMFVLLSWLRPASLPGSEDGFAAQRLGTVKPESPPYSFRSV
jgi:hypothetical protein